MRKVLLAIIIAIATGMSGACYAQNHTSTKSSCFLGKERPSGCILKKLKEEYKSSDIYYNDAFLEGFWFKPHEASDVNIFFHKGHLFELKTYHDKHGQIEEIYKTGTYSQKGDSIYLKSSDGWRLALRWWSPWPKDKNKYITKGKRSNFRIYLVKGSD